MARAFTRIAFTPNVQAVQSQMGSRQAYRQMEIGDPEIAVLGQTEIDFIGERDSFYQASVGENGWPYVQHRGGPPGFLKVLNERTLGYADFSGNRQYISVGNLAGNDRVSLFLMDYPQQRRLKIWGRVRLVDEGAAPALIAQLASPAYRARVERAVLIEVEAYDWNCPKHISARYSQSEVEALLSAARQQVPVTGSAPLAALGRGPLSLVVTGIRQLTPRVRAYELRRLEWGNLPAAAAGAHLLVPVQLPDGPLITRQYSLTNHPNRRDLYEIAVLREDDGGGGSRALHAGWQMGTRINIDEPVNQFPLHDDPRPAVLIAGGIGITPIKAMAHALHARGTPFELHYSGRLPEEMAYRDSLAIAFPGRVHLYFSRQAGQARLPVAAVLRQAAADALIYVCGPATLIEAVSQTSQELGIARERIQFESFL